MPSMLSCDYCGESNQPLARYCRACGHSLQGASPTIYNSVTGQLLANSLLKQRYRIIEPIGWGGFGTVYRAEDTQLGNRQVALKEMSQSSLSPQKRLEAADYFRQEAIILARLQHPNLPSIFDHFEEQGRWYLVMSFIEGETLKNYLGHQPEGRLPLDEVVEIGKQLCDVLDYLHRQQPAIIFRDLKPDNIMRSLNGHIYLIDFGIARHFKAGQAKDTTNYGSNGYASPEQYGRTQTTPRSDIYSLGATLHQLLSGRDPAFTPFRFPPLQSLVPAVPAGLATFITQMLEMDESKRPANTLLVKQELQTFASSAVAQPPVQTANPQPVPPASPTPSAIPLQTTTPSASQPNHTPATNQPQPIGTLLFTFAGHFRDVQSAVWSSDGKRIISGSDDGTIQVWNADGSEQPFIYKGHTEPLHIVAWSPDGQCIASSSNDATLQVWNADGSDKPLIHHLSTPVISVSWSPDGQHITLGSSEGTVQMLNAHDGTAWMLHTNQIIPTYDRSTDPYDIMQSTAWSPDGQRIASASDNETVHVWHVDGSRRPFTYHQSAPVIAVSWSPDGQRIASASDDETVHVWNVNGSGKPFIYHQSAPVINIYWSPDGQRIASTSDDETVEIWNVDGSGKPFIYRQSAPVIAVSWSPDGQRIASASDDETIQVWNVDGSGKPFTYRGHSSLVATLAWSPDATRIASGSIDGIVQIWHSDGSKQPFIYRQSFSIASVACSPDGQRVVSGSSDGTAQILNVSDGTVQVLNLDNGTASMFNTFNTNKIRRKPDHNLSLSNSPLLPYAAIHSVAWSPDGKYIALGASNGVVQIWHVDGSGKPFVYKVHSSPVTVVAWSPDGKRIASGSDDETVQVWHIDGSSKPSVYKRHAAGLVSVAWSPDGLRIVSASNHRVDAVHVWQVDGSGNPFIYEGHNYYAWEVFVTSVSWSPDGSYIASSTSGETDAPDAISKAVHVWKADGSGQPFIYYGHRDVVLSVAWSPDGSHIASTSKDQTVQVWSAG